MLVRTASAAHRARGLLVVLATAVAAIPAVARETRLGERLFFVKGKPGTATEFQMIVAAGCNDEANADCRGLAHFVEHLVLVGRNAEHREAAMSMFPDASSNGWTNDRATAYVHRLPPRTAGPKADLEQLFRYYATRLREIAVTDAEAARERNVVMQEHDARVGVSVAARFSRDLDRKLIPDHPAGQWTIGTRDTISSLKVEDARAFHKTWYAINNVYFVVKADIDASEVKAIAAKALAELQPRDLPARHAMRQPGIADERDVVALADRTFHQHSLAVRKLVRLPEDDREATRAAQIILQNYLSSRFPGSAHDVLVEDKGLTNSVGVSIARVAPDTFKLTISASPAPEVEAADLQKALEDYVAGLDKVPLSGAIILRLQKRLAEARIEADKDQQQVFHRLAGWLAAGYDYENLARWPQRLAAVTESDVRHLAKGLAAPGRVVVGQALPAP